MIPPQAKISKWKQPPFIASPFHSISPARTSRNQIISTSGQNSSFSQGSYLNLLTRSTLKNTRTSVFTAEGIHQGGKCHATLGHFTGSKGFGPVFSFCRPHGGRRSSTVCG